MRLAQPEPNPAPPAEREARPVPRREPVPAPQREPVPAPALADVSGGDHRPFGRDGHVPQFLLKPVRTT